MISEGRFTPVWANWKCILICFFVSLANCQYGFDTNAVAGFQAMVGFLKIFGVPDPESPTGWGIQTTPQQLISSFLNVGTIVGTMLTVPFAHRFGRKPAIWVGCFFAFIACAVQIGTTSLGGLYAGRIILGLSNGFLITFSNIYNTEVAPPHLRGMTVSFFGVWVNIGSVFGSLCDDFTKNHLNELSYRIPLGVLFAIPTLLSVLMIFVPESPRWLLLQNRPDQARIALQKLRGRSLTPELFEEEFIEMERGIAEEQELASSGSVLDIFRGTNLRRTIITVGSIITHAATGLWFILSFGTYFFQSAGLSQPFLVSLLGNCLGLVGACVGLLLTQYVFGRRSMMMIGALGCGFSMLAIAVAYTVAPTSKSAGSALLGFALLFYFFYNGFIGTVSWPIAGEVCASRLRVATMSLGTGSNYFFNWLIAYCTPFFINPLDLNWGPKYGYIWAGSCFIAFVFVVFLVPETKGRTLEEIDELFENRVSVWGFRKYECISSEAAKEIAHGLKGNSSELGVSVQQKE